MPLVFKKKASKVEDWISREEACKLLGIKSTSLTNYIISGKIPDRYITKTVTGSKFFYRPGLLGFDN
jgi:hypothetical protein